MHPPPPLLIRQANTLFLNIQNIIILHCSLHASHEKKKKTLLRCQYILLVEDRTHFHVSSVETGPLFHCRSLPPVTPSIKVCHFGAKATF